MGKKNKKEKDNLEVKDPVKDEKVEDNDKVSIKKTFRDTGIIMGVIAAIVGILFFATKDAVFTDAREGEEEEHETLLGDPEVAYNNMIKFANKELIDTKNFDSSLEYVSGIASIEYSSNKTIYCALGDKQEDYNYIVKITFNHVFKYAEDFIFAMTNLNMNNAVVSYGVTVDILDRIYDDQIADRFDSKKDTTLSYYDETKSCPSYMYRNTNGDTCYAVTYAGSDSNIHCINELKYIPPVGESTDFDFAIISEYKISPDTSVSMYALLEMIITE